MEFRFELDKKYIKHIPEVLIWNMLLLYTVFTKGQ